MSLMVVIAFVAVASALAFFLYVLVQFWLEDRHPRRGSETPVGFPMVASGQIVMPREAPRGKRRANSANQKTQGESENRRRFPC
jgi:hypothetical protein